MNKSPISFYLSYTKNHITSFIFLIPLIMIYELISLIKFSNKDFIIRNSADSFFRDLFNVVSINPIYYYMFLLSLFCIYIAFKIKNDIVSYDIKANYLFLMYLEGALLGFLLLLLLNNNLIGYSINYYEDIFLTFYLCLGAGIWEEILFRFILISIFLFVCKSIFFLKNIKFIISILLSSILFSSFHYIGSGADIYSHYTFIIRFIGGLLLGLIYLSRGLGISCMTHFCYDSFLISFPIIKIL